MISPGDKRATVLSLPHFTPLECSRGYHTKSFPYPSSTGVITIPKSNCPLLPMVLKER